MSLTRRSIIRDAVLLSAATAISSPLSLLSGCKKNEANQSTAGKPGGPNSYSGMRILFSGAWLFTQDSTPGWMRAVSLDMPLNMPSMQHNFGYGVWPNKALFSNSLDPNPGQPTKYMVTVDGYLPPWKASFDTLYSTAAGNSLGTESFTYLENSPAKIRVNYNAPQIRIIQLPIPSRIIPAAFLDGSYVSETDNYGMLKYPGSKGIPTTHIFNYDNAVSLVFSGSGTGPDSAAAGQNYHFRTAVKDSTAPFHAPEMFRNLMGLLCPIDPNSSALKLDLENCTKYTQLYPGSRTPPEITKEELEMVANSHTGTLASCAGGGGGLLGGCDPDC